MNSPEETLVANLILPIIKDILAPKIENIFKSNKKLAIKPENISLSFEEYLKQRYEKYIILDTLVFPNKQTLLKELYEPLTLVRRTINDKKLEIKIDRYPKKLLAEHYRIIIEDTAGMGKSTLIKKIFLSIIEEKEGIPIIIELRKINLHNTILNEILLQITPMGEQINTDILLSLISEGEFIFMFDGYDEIPILNRDFAINELHNFIEKANNNYFIITSRPEDSLVSFGDFQKFNVRPLLKNEAFSLIKRYDFYSYLTIAENLIKSLIEGQNECIKEFMTNPFLVSLLYKSYEYKKDIPIKKSQFYSQVYDALFETHDLSKDGYLKREKYCNLHIDDFERVLRYIGYFTAIENKVEYDKNYIINLIEKLKNHFSDIKFKASDYLKDLLETVPLFRKDGYYYKWSHKSLQDYFAAKFVWIDAKENQLKILTKIYNDGKNIRFYNMLDIFYELDINTFNNTILSWYLNDFKEYVKLNYNETSSVSIGLLKNRIEYSFDKKITLVVVKKEHYDIIRSGPSSNYRNVFEYYDNMVTHDYQSMHCNYYEKSRIVVLVFSNFENNHKMIGSLLEGRKSDLIKNVIQKSKFSNLKLLKEDSAYILDFDQNNILNNDEIYEEINNLIINEISFVLDFDKALNKVLMIENNKLTDIENDLLNW